MTLGGDIYAAITAAYRQHVASWTKPAEMLESLADAAAHAAEHHNSTPIQPADAIAALSRQSDIVALQLGAAVASACPGPHRPTQHRDGQPPWCRACGRTADGRRIQEMGP